MIKMKMMKMMIVNDYDDDDDDYHYNSKNNDVFSISKAPTWLLSFNYTFE